MEHHIERRPPKSANMKALLLRIGIDTGTDGTLAPIFDDGSFEYIPISERWPSKEIRTYGNTIGRIGKPLSTYLPKSIANRLMHFDPVNYHENWSTFVTNFSPPPDLGKTVLSLF